MALPLLPLLLGAAALYVVTRKKAPETGTDGSSGGEQGQTPDQSDTRGGGQSLIRRDTFALRSRAETKEPSQEPETKQATQEPKQEDSSGPMVIVLEPKAKPYLDERTMVFCTFQGQFQIRLPSGAKWATKDAAYVSLHEHKEGTLGDWTWTNVDTGGWSIADIQLKGSESPIIQARNNFWSCTFQWIDAEGKDQTTKVIFAGPDKPGEQGELAYALCGMTVETSPKNLGLCTKCKGSKPGSRLEYDE